jgi:hypothetical protein
MGILFIALAIHLFTFTLPIIGKILASLIVLIGAINVYYGFKQKRYITAKKSDG